MTYDEVLSRFKVKRSYRDKAQCICPSHNDKEASLTISKGSPKVRRGQSFIVMPVVRRLTFWELWGYP